MPVNLKNRVTRLRIAALAFAFAGVAALVATIAEPTRLHIAQTVLWFSLCVVFIANARNKQEALQSQQEDPSNKSQ